jgi:tRNA(Ser,Leu) C12 N-acetylase TAN1
MDWNVVATTSQHGYRRAWELLRELGRVQKTDFYNVLAMRVENIPVFLEELRQRISGQPPETACLARAVPVSQAFNFQSPEEFRHKAREIAVAWAPRLAGKRFHVRLHRRGFKGRLSSPEEEVSLDQAIQEAVAAQGLTTSVDFVAADAIVAVETIGSRAGLALLTKEDMEQYPFLRME